ncbi:MAG: mechanosensitive ion channel family protein [Myxococcales bacterium]|nr:mechanosensitive ion channel family protein [Myxococcales bacterium]
MPDWLNDIWQVAPARAAIILAGTFLLAGLLERGMRWGFGLLNARTRWQLPEQVLDAVRRPTFVTVLALGAEWASREGHLHERVVFVVRAVLATVAIILWTWAGMRLASAALHRRSRNGLPGLIQPSTLPVFDIMAKVTAMAVGLYLVFLAWDINLTAWLASAGVLGIAVGFAAKDTLANLFAGIFILADRPYQLGDWIVLGELRGRVTHIGVRSTRLVTINDIEITVPNAMIAEGKIVNEAGGPQRAFRMAVSVGVAYGSDIQAVRDALMEAARAQAALLADDPPPVVRFMAFGDSSLDFTLYVYVEDPGRRELILDALNTEVYAALAQANITIPFPQRDVWLRNAPGG